MNDIQTNVIKSKEENSDKVKIELKVVSPLEFEGDIKSNIMTSDRLCDIIGSFFGSFFQDYYGCIIKQHTNVELNPETNALNNAGIPFGGFYVNLFFKDQGKATDGRIKTLYQKNAEKTESSTLAARYMQYNNTHAAASTIYKVSSDTETLLSLFMNNPIRNWAMYESEELVPMTAMLNSKPEVVERISCLSLDKIITMIYGSRTADSTYEYRTTLASPINAGSKFILTINQLDTAFVRELQNELGYNRPTDTFRVYNRT